MKANSGAGRGVRVLLLVLVVLVLGFAWLIRSAYRVGPAAPEVSLDRVYRYAANGQIMSAQLLDEDALITGQVCSVPTAPAPEVSPVGEASTPASRCEGRTANFQAAYPRSDVATQQLIERIALRAPLVVDRQSGKGITKLVVTSVFPLLILANLFGIIVMSKGGDSSLAAIAGFGKIGRKRQRKRHVGTGVTFADVAGADEAVAELREVTDYLREPAKFEDYGAAAPKGVLLFGPPGCGKTLLARAVAGESGVPFFSISGAEFVESLVGVGAARVRDLFRQVREVAPAIVFIDEIDAVGRRRGGDAASGGEREQTVNQLLVEIDGFEVTSGIVLMAATNRPDILDPALLRPGRFDRHITLDAPDVHGRRAILEVHARSRPLSVEVDLDYVARRTPGFTGADLANVINEAALLAIRGGRGPIETAHINEAILRVLHGPQRRGRIMTSEERKRIAFHETGHALVATSLGQGGDLQRISIVARGRGLGQSVTGDESERVLFTRSELQAQLAASMAGMAAEELCFGEPSTSSQDDLAKATGLAREMVGLYGMSPGVGPLSLLQASGGYLGGDRPTLDSVSGSLTAEFHEETKRVVEKALQTATQVLTRHRADLEMIAEQLEEEESLEGPALKALLSRVRPEANLLGGGPAEPDPVNGRKAARTRSGEPARRGSGSLP